MFMVNFLNLHHNFLFDLALEKKINILFAETIEIKHPI